MALDDVESSMHITIRATSSGTDSESIAINYWCLGGFFKAFTQHVA